MREAIILKDEEEGYTQDWWENCFKLNADVIVLIATTEEELQDLVNRVNQVRKKYANRRVQNKNNGNRSTLSTYN